MQEKEEEEQKKIKHYLLAEHIEILNASPILYLRDINALTIADVHLGIETIMAEDGVTAFDSQTEEITRKIIDYVKKIKPEKVIINGDLKHSFKEPTKIENREVKKFLEVLSLFIREITVVKGNHDVFLSWVTREIKNCTLVEDLYLGRYFFTHGHKELPEFLPETIKFIVIGHEHPLFYKKVQGLQILKEKAFFKGPINKKEGEEEKDREIIVQPAFSLYYGGNPIDPRDQSTLLSPILRNQVSIIEFESYVLLEKEKEVLHFPKFKEWF